MKHLIISIVILWGVFQISSFIWSSKGQPPSAILTRLLEPPQYRLTNPSENGYFYLIGFAAAASLDPAKVGHEMWVETSAAPGAGEFDYDKPGRSELEIQLPIEQVLPPWVSEKPARDIRNMDVRIQTLSDRERTLFARYERWLSMPFEDMGFGHRGTPRVMEMLVAHRLYIADGFARKTALGMERLKKDTQAWRRILGDSTTIATKVMAQIVITDNLRLLSTLLSQPVVNKAVLAMIPNIAAPLATAELSLQWPLQHQFMLGVHGDRIGGFTREGHTESLSPQKQWLTRAARLPEQAFRQIAHPPGHSFLGISLHTRETWEMYAIYYNAIIHAAETGQSTWPKLHELASQSIVQWFVHPAGFEPDWDPFRSQLKETDTKLRLVSLQAVLRRQSAQTSVPDRLAQVGSSYFDPFSGLPMLWSPTQQKIYSVGKDRFDDGGDPSFDISVPAVVSFASLPKESPPSVFTRRAR
jgi:hypothetical protein